MYFAYTDESGDSGFINSPTKYFVLACVLVHESNWQTTLDQLIELRRGLRSAYGVPVRVELKAEDLVYGRGALASLRLSRQERMQLYRTLLGIEEGLDVRTFAIAIAKERIVARSQNDPRSVAWTYLTQRLDTFCRKQEGTAGTIERVLLLPDEGHGPLARKIVRKGRRFQTIRGFYGGQLDIRSRFILEDPFDKRSSESYFTQVADWNAYVAHRYKDIDPRPRRVPPDLWDGLGETRLLEVNDVTGGPPGIVVWPRK